MTDFKQNWLSEFELQSIEDQYRRESIDGVKRVNYFVTLIIVSACLLFLKNDFDAGGFAWPIFAARVLMIAVAGLACLVSYRSDSWQPVFGSSYVITLVVVSSILWINFQRPVTFLENIGVDAIVLVGIYFAVPSIRFQFAITAAFTVGLLLLHFLVKEPDSELANTTIPVSLVLANLFGGGASMLFNRTRRQLFAQKEVEREMRLELSESRSEIQVLSQLIPMCAGCKKVRNDEGYWEQVEIFMKSASGRDVSHGLCPQCEEATLSELKPD